MRLAKSINHIGNYNIIQAIITIHIKLEKFCINYFINQIYIKIIIIRLKK